DAEPAPGALRDRQRGSEEALLRELAGKRVPANAERDHERGEPGGVAEDRGGEREGGDAGKRRPDLGQARRREPEHGADGEDPRAEPGRQETEEQPGRLMVNAVVGQGLAVPVVPLVTQPAIRAEMENL